MIRVTAAIIIDDDRYLIAQRALTGKLPGQWEFPGGKVEKDESPEQCLIREIREELGVTISVQDYFATSTHTYDFGTIELMAYTARIVDGTPTAKEHNAIEWVTRPQLTQYSFAQADIPFIKQLMRDQQ